MIGIWGISLATELMISTLRSDFLPLKKEKEKMALSFLQVMSQEAVKLQDVAVVFTPAQWRLLSPEEKLV